MPFLFISVHFGIGATIRIGQEIQCLLYAGFFSPIEEMGGKQEVKVVHGVN